MLALEALVTSSSRAAFLRTQWGTKVALFRETRARHVLGFGLPEAKEILTSHSLRYPSIVLVRNGKWIPPHEYVEADLPWGHVVFSNLIAPHAVLREYRSGATATFQALHLQRASVAAFCCRLQDELGANVHANAYLTPPGGRGFTWHVDEHDVFVVQIAGRKDYWTGSQGARKPIIMRPGHVLYLPKGARHRAQASSDLSLHISIGVVATTARDLVSSAIAQHKEARLDERLFPDKQTGKGRAAMAAMVRDRLRHVADRLDIASALDVTSATRLRNPSAVVHDNLLRTGRLSASTRILLRPDMHFQLRDNGASVVLKSAAGETSFSRVAHPALKRLVAHRAVAIGSLPELEARDRLALATHLYSAGLVVITDQR